MYNVCALTMQKGESMTEMKSTEEYNKKLEEVLHSDESLDKLGAVEHIRWAHWQEYLFSKCNKNDDGTLTIPSDLVVRWKRLVDLHYKELTRDEQQSDIGEAISTLDVIMLIVAYEL